MDTKTESESLTIEGLQALFDRNKADTKTENKTMVEALLSDWTEKNRAAYKIDNGPEKPADLLKKGEKLTSTEVAEMNDALGGITGMQFMGIPVGQAVVGGFVAVIATELVDGFMATQGPMIRGVVKLGAAFVAIKFGKKLLGDTGSKAVALLVTFDAVRDFFPVDVYAQKIASKLTGLTLTAGLAGGNRTMKALSPEQAKNYYSASGL